MLLLISVVFVVFISMTGHASQLALSGNVTKFSDGDRVIFVGDSITHGGSYHINIALFNALRYPSKKIAYFNAGISGDTAHGTNLRFDRDIAIHKANIATIMLGMNDVGGPLYETSANSVDEKTAKSSQQKIIRHKYLKEMFELATSLQDSGAEIIFVTPSIYDETANLELPSQVGRNTELAVYADKLLQLAKQFDSQVVDFQKPMLEINAKMQTLDSTQTIVSKDRVHPGDAGHLLMAYAFLKAQNESPTVSNIEINVSRRFENKFDHCELAGDVYYTNSGLEFNCKQMQLPFPLNEDQTKALEWVPFQKELNQMRFAITNLAKGTYRLSIDEQVVANFSETQLAEGINLANYSHTPIYQQALAVKQLNDKRAQFERKLRDIAHVSYSMLDKYPELDRNDQAAVKRTLEQHVEKSLGKPWHGYLQNQVKKYLSDFRNLVSLRQDADVAQAKMYKQNQPKMYSWSLVKI